MSAIRPDLRTESVLPPELRPQGHWLELGLQELSRTESWRALAPYIKRILTSYLGGGMPEDKNNWESSVARYRVGWEKERIATDAERLWKEPLVIKVLEIQRGVVSQ